MGGSCFGIKSVFSGIGILAVKERRSWDGFNFILIILILVKQHFYTTTGTPGVVRSHTFMSQFWWGLSGRSQFRWLDAWNLLQIKVIWQYYDVFHMFVINYSFTLVSNSWSYFDTLTSDVGFTPGTLLCCGDIISTYYLPLAPHICVSESGQHWLR